MYLHCIFIAHAMLALLSLLFKISVTYLSAAVWQDQWFATHCRHYVINSAHVHASTVRCAGYCVLVAMSGRQARGRRCALAVTAATSVIIFAEDLLGVGQTRMVRLFFTEVHLWMCCLLHRVVPVEKTFVAGGQGGSELVSVCPRNFLRYAKSQVVVRSFSLVFVPGFRLHSQASLPHHPCSICSVYLCQQIR